MEMALPGIDIIIRWHAYYIAAYFGAHLSILFSSHSCDLFPIHTAFIPMTAVMLDQFGSNLVHVGTVTVGASQSYYFRQKLSDEKTSACNYRQPKQIIPSVPRTRT